MAEVIQARPLRGSRISSFYPVKQLPALSSLDSAFQLQEYISLLIRLDVHDVDTIVSIPDKGATGSGSPPLEDTAAPLEKQEEGEDAGEGKSADEKSTSSPLEEDSDGSKRESSNSSPALGSTTVDESCWIYEQLRRLAQDLSHPLITMLQLECTRATCPEMKAGEWLYLCVAHGNDGAMEQCCAIDYILHTLDSATALLNSPRAFPSRLQIPQTSHRHFSSLARRLGRIFAHAYFHHREAFEQAEAESSLYARFLALTSKFDLVPAEFLVIPTRMIPASSGEGDEADSNHPSRSRSLHPTRPLGPFTSVLMPELNTNVSSYSTSGPDSAIPGRRSEAGNFGQQSQHNPPGLGVSFLDPIRGQSPRKSGRNRTDTMVHSDGYNIAEELARSHAEHSSSDGHSELTNIPLDNDQDPEQDQDDRNSSPAVPDSPLEHPEHQPQPLLPEADKEAEPAPTPESSADEVSSEKEAEEVAREETFPAQATTETASSEEPPASMTKVESTVDATPSADDASSDIQESEPTNEASEAPPPAISEEASVEDAESKADINADEPKAVVTATPFEPESTVTEPDLTESAPDSDETDEIPEAPSDSNGAAAGPEEVISEKATEPTAEVEKEAPPTANVSSEPAPEAADASAEGAASEAESKDLEEAKQEAESPDA